MLWRNLTMYDNHYFAFRGSQLLIVCFISNWSQRRIKPHVICTIAISTLYTTNVFIYLRTMHQNVYSF